MGGGQASGAGRAGGKARGSSGSMQFELRSGPTPAAMGFGLVGFAVVVYLFQYGYTNLAIYPPEGGYDATIGFAYLPMAFSAVLLLLIGYSFASNMGRVITVRKDGIRFVGGNLFFDANWGVFTYIGPSHGIKGVRSMVIGNRETRVRLDELFLPNFDRLNGFLETLMGRIEAGHRDDDD